MGTTPMHELNENVKETDGEDDEYSDDADQDQINALTAIEEAKIKSPFKEAGGLSR